MLFTRFRTLPLAATVDPDSGGLLF